MAWMENICLFTGLICTASGLSAENIQLIHNGLKLVYNFQQKDLASGWNQTQQIKVIPSEQNLQLKGNGWDAKIFRTINLPAGYYLVTACGKGKHLQVQIAKDFSAAGVIFDLNLAGGSNGADWRTDWRPLNIEKPITLLLIIRASASEPATSFINSN